tara:strand:- start:100 stop:1494 length:1395 start_codon:yes stop_codon:yes gene_type:complete
MQDTSYFDLSDDQLEQIGEKYALLEPLLDEKLSPDQRRAHLQEIMQKLRVSKRTVRRYLYKLRKQGVRSLLRQSRSDAGAKRVVSDELLGKAEELLKQRPQRSIPLVKRILEADPELGEQAQKVSASSFYHYLSDTAGKLRKKWAEEQGRHPYRRFEAEYPNQLWQGDARHGIPLPHPVSPGKTKMTYLFGWVDDYSRKIMCARYFWDEKLPRMEECFRLAALRWGLPDKLYCDNGRVYISNHFLIIVTELSIRKIHHAAYAAWCKGKIENVMKAFKRFQEEAALADFKTLEELNSALSAWIEVEYNNKIHSQTGQTPNDRWRDGIAAHPPRRVKDLDEFNSCFLSRAERKINKFGKVRFESNHYPVDGLPVGTVVELRYNPFDLSKVQMFHKNNFCGLLHASKLNRKVLINIPEERKRCTYSPEAVRYFTILREKADELNRRQLDQLRYSDLKKEGEDHGQSH